MSETDNKTAVGFIDRMIEVKFLVDAPSWMRDQDVNLLQEAADMYAVDKILVAAEKLDQLLCSPVFLASPTTTDTDSTDAPSSDSGSLDETKKEELFSKNKWLKRLLVDVDDVLRIHRSLTVDDTDLRYHELPKSSASATTTNPAVPEPSPKSQAKALESSAPDHENEWIEVANSDGIRTYYRQEKNTAVHSIKVHAELLSPLLNICSVVNECDLIPTFMTMVKMQAESVRQLTNFSKLVYFKVGMPWPLEDRDVLFVGRGADMLERGCITILAHPAPDDEEGFNTIYAANTSAVSSPTNRVIPQAPYPSHTEGVTRMGLRFSGGIIRAVGPHRSLLSALFNVDPKLAVVPTTFINFMTRQFAHLGFELLRSQMATSRYNASKFAERVKEKEWLYGDIRERVRAMWSQRRKSRKPQVTHTTDKSNTQSPSVASSDNETKDSTSSPVTTSPAYIHKHILLPPSLLAPSSEIELQHSTLSLGARMFRSPYYVLRYLDHHVLWAGRLDVLTEGRMFGTSWRSVFVIVRTRGIYMFTDDQSQVLTNAFKADESLPSPTSQKSSQRSPSSSTTTALDRAEVTSVSRLIPASSQRPISLQLELSTLYRYYSSLNKSNQCINAKAFTATNDVTATLPMEINDLSAINPPLNAPIALDTNATASPVSPTPFSPTPASPTPESVTPSTEGKESPTIADPPLHFSLGETRDPSDPCCVSISVGRAFCSDRVKGSARCIGQVIKVVTGHDIPSETSGPLLTPESLAKAKEQAAKLAGQAATDAPTPRSQLSAAEKAGAVVGIGGRIVRFKFSNEDDATVFVDALTEMVNECV